MSYRHKVKTPVQFSGDATALKTPKTVVIGAGIGGLVSALTLACRGMDVTVIEQDLQPGGKLRAATIEGERIDCGPTVFTMKDVFEEVFDDAGTSLDAHLRLVPCEILARHAWQNGTAALDLHTDIERSADAIAQFAGPTEADGYRAFCLRAREVFHTLDKPFIRSPRPDFLRLIGAATRAGGTAQMAPFSTLWRTLGHHFRDPRLRQLFGRYATYCGSSPFACPATLMLVAHVEQSGVWLIEGGMHRLAAVLVQLATAHGVAFRFETAVRAIQVEAGRAAGVELATGEKLEADAVVYNGDVAALSAGLFGSEVRHSANAPKPAKRSLSAVTFAMKAASRGFPMARHNVFFSQDYAAEFDDILVHRRVPRDPTVYICAQDRGEDGHFAHADSTERLFCIVNAPAVGDTQPLDASEIAQCEATTIRTLERCGLTLDWRREHSVVTTPTDFHNRFPATGGALYGAASHGWTASFRRPGVRSRVPGLYICGGSTHPGPGLPMAAMSGRMAALSLTSDWASMRRSRPTAMLGGMSTA